MAKHLEQEARDRAARQKQVDVAAAGHAKYLRAAAARERVVIKEVERVVEKPIYSNVCFDDDGLRLLAADIAARTTPSQPAPAVPDSTGPYPAGQSQRIPVEPQPDPVL